jgi:hypothetical protein
MREYENVLMGYSKPTQVLSEASIVNRKIKVCNFYIAIISYKGWLHTIIVRWKHVTSPLKFVTFI